MKEQEGCELLNRAKALALVSGLNPEQVNCPIMKYCSGKECILMKCLEIYKAEKSKHEQGNNR